MDLELFWYFRWSLSTVTKSKSYVTSQLTPNYLYNIFWAWWEWDRSLCVKVTLQMMCFSFLSRYNIDSWKKILPSNDSGERYEMGKLRKIIAPSKFLFLFFVTVCIF